MYEEIILPSKVSRKNSLSTISMRIHCYFLIFIKVSLMLNAVNWKNDISDINVQY